MFSIKQGQPGDPVALRNIFKNAQAIGDLTNQETQFEQSVAQSVDQKVQSLFDSQKQDMFFQGNKIQSVERKFDFLFIKFVRCMVARNDFNSAINKSRK